MHALRLADASKKVGLCPSYIYRLVAQAGVLAFHVEGGARRFEVQLILRRTRRAHRAE
jgi:hypothetical protein